MYRQFWNWFMFKISSKLSFGINLEVFWDDSLNGIDKHIDRKIQIRVWIRFVVLIIINVFHLIQNHLHMFITSHIFDNCIIISHLFSIRISWKMVFMVSKTLNRVDIQGQGSTYRLVRNPLGTRFLVSIGPRPLKFRLVLCRIRPFPTLIIKMRWLRSRPPLKPGNHERFGRTPEES